MNYLKAILMRFLGEIVKQNPWSNKQNPWCVWSLQLYCWGKWM